MARLAFQLSELIQQAGTDERFRRGFRGERWSQLLHHRTKVPHLVRNGRGSVSRNGRTSGVLDVVPPTNPVLHCVVGNTLLCLGVEAE